MRASAWLNVVVANFRLEGAVTCVTTLVPPVWMQEEPAAPAATQVKKTGINSFPKK